MRVAVGLFFVLFFLPLASAQGCIEGEKQCDRNAFIKCVRGDWTVVQLCLHTCIPGQGCSATNETVYGTTPQVRIEESCSEGSVRCKRQVFQVCSQNKWLSAQTCSGNQYCTMDGCVSESALLPIPEDVSAGKACLRCPVPPRLLVEFPPAPIGEDDCALKGRSNALFQYVKALQKIASGCKARIPVAMANALALKSNIDAQINRLPVGTERSPDFSCFVGSAPSEDLPCPVFIEEELELDGKEYPTAFRFSGMLVDAKDKTAEYCRMVDELVVPVVDGCKRVEKYIETCKGTRPGTIVEYRALMEDRLKIVSRRMNELDALYAGVMKSISDFENSYDESRLSCDVPVVGDLPDVLPPIDNPLVRLWNAVKRFFGF